MKSPLVSTQAYFDCNATTPVLPAAADAALETMRTLYGNPSSSHLVGLQAKFILESTRKLAGRVLGTSDEQIIFTSGATEAVQSAVFSVFQHYKASPKTHLKKVLYGATEHKVIPQALHHWVKSLDLPLEVVELPVDSQGQIKLDVLKKELPHALLLCTMAVNNETGVIQNLAAIEAELLLSQSQVLWLVDCVQALGKLDLKLDQSRIDYAPFSGHKLYAPKGIGFLYTRKGTPLTPLIVGGGQEKGLRSGTENIPGVAALGAVLEQLLLPSESTCFHSHQHLTHFRDQLVAELKRAFPKVEFNTPFHLSVPTTINFSVPGLSSGELLDLFDSAGLRLSAGSACSSGSAKPSHVLDAMGLPEWRSTSALRLSFGPCTPEAEIERGRNIVRQCAIALQNTCLLEAGGGFEAPANLRDGIVQFRAGSTNSWLIADSKSKTCIIIDPSDSISDRLEHYVRCQHLEILAILDTHSHADHDSIRPVLQKILAAQMKNSAKNFGALGWPNDKLTYLKTVTLETGQKADALVISSTEKGELVLAKIKTPGHTDDSQSFLLGYAVKNELKKESIQVVFPGDTILSGGLGRTNFSMSDPVALFHSLRIFQDVVSPNALLCPAHDYNNSFATSLQTEQAGNKLLALALGPMTPFSLESFLQNKKEIDQELARLEENFQGIVCGVTPTSQTSESCNPTLPLEKLESYLEKNPKTLVVDVREAQEFALFREWNTVGLKQPPRNVPLSRFVNFMKELTENQKNEQEILLICKTGTRSLQAAKSLRRLGFHHAWSLSGGIGKAPGQCK